MTVAWLDQYPWSEQLDDEHWLVAFPLTFGRGRVAVATSDGPTGTFY